MGGYDTCEDDWATTSADFRTIEARHGFIRKVFGILAVQWAVTSAVICGMWYWLDPFEDGSAKDGSGHRRTFSDGEKSLLMAMMAVSIGMMVSMMFIMCCCQSVLRKSPQNYIILSVWTLAMGVFAGIVCAQYTSMSILLCGGGMFVICTALAALASQTKYDFTGWMPYLFVIGLVLSITALIFTLATSARFGSPMHKVFSALFLLLSCCYFIMEVQMIVGGKNKKYVFGIDDYVLAAICIYQSMLDILLQLLALFGDRR